jgi:hypothetical protein
MSNLKPIANPVADAYRAYLNGADIDWFAIAITQANASRARLKLKARELALDDITAYQKTKRHPIF